MNQPLEKALIRHALLIEYDGTHFRGWQKQTHPPIRSVEEELTKAVSKIANEPIEIIAAGRTDAGVHAQNLIAHFDTSAIRKPHAWLLGINSNLPDDCAVKGIATTPFDFHARHSANGRHYRYSIYNARHRSPIYRHFATWIHTPLDIKKMQRAATALIGEHDFSAFRSSECQSHSTHRYVEEITIQQQGALITIDLIANAFLHHMARNIVGTLLEVGRGKEPIEYVKKVLESQDRTKGGMNAPPQGLSLQQVRYPQLLTPKFSLLGE